MARRALIRLVPASFADATTLHPPSDRIDVAVARRQHQSYAALLRSMGVEVTALDAHPELPDCPFVEDQAVVRDGVALITRSGHAGRRAERTAVAEALAPHARVERVRSPGTVDGGDVLTVGKRMFVGRSDRTNEAGIEAVRELFSPLGYQVRAVAVPPGTLHLKCLCSALSDDAVVVADDVLDPSLFSGLTVVRVPREDAYAANVVAVGRRVIVADGHRAATTAIARAGYDPMPLDMSEFRKADGALTCLSVFF